DDLRPHYAQSFRCIGADCEDTCCHGLDVVIDKAGYQRLNSLQVFQKSINEHFVILQNPSESQYARLQLTQDFTCPLLSPNHLCGIQQEHGEYYLANICATYPRITQRIDGLRETALLLSCPEAARLVLLNPHLIAENMSSRAHRYSRFTQAI